MTRIIIESDSKIKVKKTKTPYIDFLPNVKARTKKDKLSIHFYRLKRITLSKDNMNSALSKILGVNISLISYLFDDFFYNSILKENKIPSFEVMDRYFKSKEEDIRCFFKIYNKLDEYSIIKVIYLLLIFSYINFIYNEFIDSEFTKNILNLNGIKDIDIDSFVYINDYDDIFNIYINKYKNFKWKELDEEIFNIFYDISHTFLEQEKILNRFLKHQQVPEDMKDKCLKIGLELKECLTKLIGEK